MPVASIADVPLLSLPRIEAFMLWPDNDQAREKAQDAVSARFFERMAPHMADLPMGPNASEVIAWLTSILPRQQIEDLAKRRFCEGVVIGLFILDCIREHRATGTGVDPRPAKGRALDLFARLGRPCDIKNFDANIWRPLRPAGHLWAAYAEETLKTGVEAFSGALNVERLLGASDELLMVGSGIKLTRSRHYLLDPATAWRLVLGSIN